MVKNKMNQMTMEEFIESTLRDYDDEDLMYLLKDPLWILENSLYLDKRENKRICKYMGKLINLSARLFESLYQIASEPNKSHILDEYNYDNERQIIRRIKKAFLEAGFRDHILSKVRGIEGYKINTNVLPERFIITL